MKKSLQKLLLVMGALLLFAVPSMAQSTDPMSGMDMGTDTIPSTLIDGSQNPELIPDILVFRLWLSAHTVNGQITGVDAVNFSNSNDGVLLTAAMQKYYSIQSKADASYAAINSSPVLSALPTSRTQYWKSHNDLVTSLLNGLQGSLSGDGVQQFRDFLQEVKKGAKVSPYDSALGEVGERNLREHFMVASSGAMPQQGGMTPSYNSFQQTTTTFPATTVSDTFQRANGGLGSNWLTATGSFFSGGFAITNHIVQPTTTAVNTINSTALWHTTSTKNQTVTMTLGKLPANNNGVGVVARASRDGVTSYWAFMMITAAPVKYQIYLVNTNANGIAHVLGSFTSTTPFLVGDKMTLQTFNSAIDVIYTTGSNRPETVIAIIDTSVPSGSYYGIEQTSYVGAGGTTASYGGYSSFSAGNGTALTILNQLTGDTICSGGVCPIGAMHTGYVHAKIGSQGGIVQGPQTLPQNNMTVTANPTIIAENIGSGDSWDFQFDVICSIVGNFYGFQPGAPAPTSGANWQPCWTYPNPNAPQDGPCDLFWFPQTFTYTTGWTTGNPKIYYETLNCTPSTTPPDYVPTAATVSDSYPIIPYNFVWYGVCIAPPLGAHNGQFFCTGGKPIWRADIQLLHGTTQIPQSCTRHNQLYIP